MNPGPSFNMLAALALSLIAAIAIVRCVAWLLGYDLGPAPALDD